MFLDIINYAAPGASYDQCTRAYGAKQAKSWFPYEWFDNPDKLDYEGLPPYDCWYPELKKEYVLTEEELQECKQTFAALGMRTFRE